MSCFSSAFYLTAALAMSSLAAPIAFARSASDATHHVTMHAPVMRKAAATCFTQDLVPNDDSSMLTVCGANGPSTVIFAE